MANTTINTRDGLLARARRVDVDVHRRVVEESVDVRRDRVDDVWGQEASRSIDDAGGEREHLRRRFARHRDHLRELEVDAREFTRARLVRCLGFVILAVVVCERLFVAG